MEGCETSSYGDKMHLQQQPVLPSLQELPVCCQLDQERGVFRVIRARGKTLSSGGFGVTISEENTEKESHQKGGVDENSSHIRKEKYSAPNTPSTAETYLHIEEVVFLHDRGLLQCLPPPPGLSLEQSVLDSSQLYQLIPAMGMSLPVYFVYAYLRSQDFRVLRHCPRRLEILKRQEKLGNKEKMSKELRQLVRESVQHAPAPTIDGICFDVYVPQASFAKTHPGPPDFYVAVSFYNQAQLSFQSLHRLLMEKAQGLPLKLATVSDSGTVVMFGVTNFGVPSIA